MKRVNDLPGDEYDIIGYDPSQAITTIKVGTTAGNKVLESIAKEARNVLWSQLKGDGFIKYFSPKPRGKNTTLDDFCDKVKKRLKHPNDEFYNIGKSDALTARDFVEKVQMGEDEAVLLYGTALKHYIVEKTD